MATTDIRPTITLACTVCKHRNYTTTKNRRNDPDRPAVPTFPIILSMRASGAIHGDPELGLDYSRDVHGEQEFVYHQPIHAGDRLVAVAKVASAEPKGRHELLTLETEVTNEAGEPVCTIRGTLLSRG